MPTNTSPIISPAELAALSPAPLLIDVRPSEQFAVSRIRGAVHLDLWGLSLIDTSDAPLRAFMWMIGHLFSLRGVTPDRPVVVYESDSGMRAARAYWFLDYLGHPHARILDGGVGAWTADGRELTTDVVTPVASDWHGTPDESKLATWQQVLQRLDRAGTTVLDTRSAAEYYGDAVRAKRGGAIPGAVHLEWKQNLSADGRFKAADGAADDVRRCGREAGRRGSHILPGWLSGGPLVRGAEARGVCERPQLHRLLEGMGRP